MKINGICNFKPAFGHITKRTVDMIKSHAEGYTYNRKENGFYGTDNHVKTFNFEQLSRLCNLTKRACKLDKSVIDISSDNCEYNSPAFVVCTRCYGEGDRKNTEVFYPEFDDMQTPDTDKVLNSLEKAVEYAEITELDSCTHDMFDEYGWHGGFMEDKRMSVSDKEFEPVQNNNIMNRIYDNTLNLERIK